VKRELVTGNRAGHTGQLSRSVMKLRVHFRALVASAPIACRETSKAVLRAVPWLRRLVADLSPQSPGFASGSIYVGFVVDKGALGQVFLRALRFSPVNIIPPSFSILIYHLADE
jgi:hypothetical protein